MSTKLFITGTDTEIGKTYISIGLLKAFHSQGYTTLGIKPVASGCTQTKDRLYHDDALLLQKNSSIQLAYHYINPFSFMPPVSPNIAAHESNTILTVDNLFQKMQYALNYPTDIHIIEGVGGWHVPLNADEAMSDFVKKCHFNVILVVGIRLGCLNHAILTYQAIKQSGCKLMGWIANFPGESVLAASNIISTLQEWFDEPCLGIVRYQDNPEDKIDIKIITSQL